MIKKIFILTFLFACNLTINAQSSAASGPIFHIDKDVVDYGVIDQDAEGGRKFKVYNKGTQPLLLTNCTGSCGCTVPTCPRQPILPGKSAEISIKYDTHRTGIFNKQVTIETNDPKTPKKVVMVKGEVKGDDKPGGGH